MSVDAVPRPRPEPVFEVVGEAADHGITWAWIRTDLHADNAERGRTELDALLSASHPPEWLLVYLGAECLVTVAGLRMLDAAADRLAGRGGRLILVAPPMSVRTMVELTGLGAQIPLVVSARHACAWVRRRREATLRHGGR